VGLKDILKIEDKLNFNEVYLCMEYMDYTLMRIIHSPQSNLDEEKIQFILYQLLSGIYFMHSADITHRDLKPDNILISKRLELKIADMNLAKKEIVND
jgi:mitogen-activated protein kinase 1/3